MGRCASVWQRHGNASAEPAAADVSTYQLVMHDRPADTCIDNDSIQKNTKSFVQLISLVPVHSCPGKNSSTFSNLLGKLHTKKRACRTLNSIHVSYTVVYKPGELTLGGHMTAQRRSRQERERLLN